MSFCNRCKKLYDYSCRGKNLEQNEFDTNECDEFIDIYEN